MFEHSFGLFRGVNEIYETLVSAPGEERAIESAAQERMRVALRGR